MSKDNTLDDLQKQYALLAQLVTVAREYALEESPDRDVLREQIQLVVSAACKLSI